jgi:NADH:ubiquinone oxidoreductase subunit B-like Fe-S oxidoreductase
MAVKKKRLADYGVHSERVMWQGKGPGTFEQELGDDLEQKLMLTTVDKAITWAQSSSIWPDTFGLGPSEMTGRHAVHHEVAL